MYITCCQLDIAWEDRPANYDKVRRLLDRARPPAGSLVLLPEMFATGFSMNLAASAQDPGQTIDVLRKLAREFGVDIMAGLATRAGDGRGQNIAVLVDAQGRQAGRYQKIHPFTSGGEHERYQPGSDLVIWPREQWIICPFICYDLRFPEWFRHGVRQGANLFAIIANWPAAREHHWVSLLVARAIENQAYVAAVNRCGADPSVSYSGRSLIIDPRGQIIVDAGGREGTVGAWLDLPALWHYRKRFPALADMREPHVR
jgi:omega-amidase